MIAAQPIAIPHSVGRAAQGRRVLVVLAVFVSAAVVISPTSAHAASYTVWTCANGAGKRQPATDWKPVRVSNVLGRLRSSCGDSAAEPTARLEAMAALSPANPPEASGVGWSLDAVPGTRITGLDLWMVAVAHSSVMLSRLEILAPGSIYRLDQISRWEGARFGGDEARGPGSEASAYSETNHQTYRGLSTPNVMLMSWCVTLCRGDEVAAGATAGYLAVYRVKTVVDDAAAPVGSAAGLQDGARVSAPTSVQASASDVGGGVRELTLRVDGRVVQRVGAEGECADVDAGNNDPYEYNRMQPCPGQRSTELTLSPADLAVGARHVVSVVATDAAGQDTVLGSARVARAAPPGFFASTGFVNPDLDVLGPRALNGANGGPADVRLSFAVRRGAHRRFVARRVVSAGTRPRISGRLSSALGTPIAGARVWPAVAVTNGLWQISGNPLTTSKTGRVSGRLPARSPSRDVRLVYFPYSDSSENVQSASRRLEVRAATTIQADQGGYRNGDTVRFSGRITTLPVVRRKAVYVQVIVRGRWRTFGTTRASSNGRWNLRYRFTATPRPTVYRFRAVVPADEQPVSWATGYSRALRVLVTP